MTAVGGALGGVFCGLVAPLAFDWVYEHPILVLAAAALTARVARVEPRARALAPGGSASPCGGWWMSSTAAVEVLVACAPCSVARVRVTLPASCLDGTCGARRSYFGVYTVEDAAGGRRLLVHGGTTHGMRAHDPGTGARPPTMYYGPDSAPASSSHAPELFGADASVGVVGLGAGTLACYAPAGPDLAVLRDRPARGRDRARLGQVPLPDDCAPDAR